MSTGGLVRLRRVDAWRLAERRARRRRARSTQLAPLLGGQLRRPQLVHRRVRDEHVVAAARADRLGRAAPRASSPAPCEREQRRRRRARRRRGSWRSCGSSSGRRCAARRLGDPLDGVRQVAERDAVEHLRGTPRVMLPARGRRRPRRRPRPTPTGRNSRDVAGRAGSSSTRRSARGRVGERGRSSTASRPARRPAWPSTAAIRSGSDGCESYGVGLALLELALEVAPAAASSIASCAMKRLEALGDRRAPAGVRGPGRPPPSSSSRTPARRRGCARSAGDVRRAPGAGGPRRRRRRTPAGARSRP